MGTGLWGIIMFLSCVVLASELDCCIVDKSCFIDLTRGSLHALHCLMYIPGEASLRSFKGRWQDGSSWRAQPHSSSSWYVF